MLECIHAISPRRLIPRLDDRNRHRLVAEARMRARAVARNRADKSRSNRMGISPELEVDHLLSAVSHRRFAMRRLALGSLSDGRLQLWCTDVDQQSLYTCWKEYSPLDPVDAGWTPWRPFAGPPSTETYEGISDIAALQGPDGRLTLWYVSGGAIFICRKSTVDPNSHGRDWNTIWATCTC